MASYKTIKQLYLSGDIDGLIKELNPIINRMVNHYARKYRLRKGHEQDLKMVALERLAKGIQSFKPELRSQQGVAYGLINHLWLYLGSYLKRACENYHEFGFVTGEREGHTRPPPYVHYGDLSHSNQVEIEDDPTEPTPEEEQERRKDEIVNLAYSAPLKDNELLTLLWSHGIDTSGKHITPMQLNNIASQLNVSTAMAGKYKKNAIKKMQDYAEEHGIYIEGITKLSEYTLLEDIFINGLMELIPANTKIKVL